MEKKEYLNEESYQKGKKKLIRIAIIILVVGILIGGSLIAIGIVKSNNKQDVLEENTEIDENSRTESEVQADIDSTQAEIDAKELQYQTLMSEANTIFMNEGFSDNYNAKRNEANTVLREQSDLEIKLAQYRTELFNIQSNSQTGSETVENIFGLANDTISGAKSIPYYIFGGMIIFVSLVVSGAIYFFAKRREIISFTTQQVMPVAQEGIEKMTPTIADASEEIAKGISRGIRKGKEKDQDK